MNKKLKKHRLIKFWLFQLGVLVVFAALNAVVFSLNAATSALLGGLVCLIPNVYFALKVFKYQGAQAARQIVSSFYKGEALKIIVSIILFAAVFNFCKIIPLAFFVSYILVLMTHWFAPWIIINKQNRPESD